MSGDPIPGDNVGRLRLTVDWETDPNDPALRLVVADRARWAGGVLADDLPEVTAIEGWPGMRNVTFKMTRATSGESG